jgi:hypothetical protein
MTNARIPPVPPANRSPGGSANAGGSPIPENVAKENKDSKNRHLEQQGRQGNIKQNTTNQGYQQDR